MTDPSLLGAITALVRGVAKVDSTTLIAPEHALVDDLGIDSLDLVGVFVQIQDTYGVVIDDDDIPGLVRVGDLVAYVAARRQGSAAA